MENKKLTIKFYTSVVKNVLVPKDFDSLRKKIFSEFCLDELEIKEIEIFYFSPEKKIIKNDDDYKIFLENNNDTLNVIEKSFVVISKPSKNFTEKITSFISNEMEIAMNNIKNLILNEDNRNDKNNLNLNVHYDFSCNECKKNVICGFVYKCVFEDEICLCEKCCLKHKHPMFKIK
jgi:hypothetical protein